MIWIQADLTNYWELGIVHSGKFLRQVRMISSFYSILSWPLPRAKVISI